MQSRPADKTQADTPPYTCGVRTDFSRIHCGMGCRRGPANSRTAQHHPGPLHSLGPPCFHRLCRAGSGHGVCPQALCMSALQTTRSGHPDSPERLQEPVPPPLRCVRAAAQHSLPTKVPVLSEHQGEWGAPAPAKGSHHTRARQQTLGRAPPAALSSAAGLRPGRPLSRAGPPPSYVDSGTPVKVYLNSVNTLIAMTMRWHVGRLPGSPHITSARGGRGHSARASTRPRTSQPLCWVSSVTAP